MRKTLRLVLSVILPACLALVLAACGGQATETAQGGDDATEEASGVALINENEAHAVPKTEGQGTDPDSQEGSADAHEDSADATEAQEVSTAAGVTVVMPGEWAAKGLFWMVDERFQHMVLEYALNGDRVQIAEISWDERATLPYEADDELWVLGDVSAPGAVRPAVLHILYVNADGRTYSANISEPNATLACEYFLGLSPEEILSWIELAEAQASQGEDASGLSTRTSEFCGVWAYASKDLADAVQFASDARGRGYAAEVFLTTDWENLNSEPWYVVSLACASGEGEANAVLSDAQLSGYGDAYLKWSGAYIG